MSDSTIIKQTQYWVESVIVGLNFCPFAKREIKRGGVHYQVSQDTGIEQAMHSLITECERLDKNSSIETTLLIFPNAFSHFDDYLDMLELANELFVAQGYEGIYQLASFHPDYCFEDAPADDPANYTNRSPYPMLHLLREDSLEQALENYMEAEDIPERNIRKAREIGLAAMQNLLRDCYINKK